MIFRWFDENYVAQFYGLRLPTAILAADAADHERSAVRRPSQRHSAEQKLLNLAAECKYLPPRSVYNAFQTARPAGKLKDHPPKLCAGILGSAVQRCTRVRRIDSGIANLDRLEAEKTFFHSGVLCCSLFCNEMLLHIHISSRLPLRSFAVAGSGSAV